MFIVYSYNWMLKQNVNEKHAKGKDSVPPINSPPIIGYISRNCSVKWLSRLESAKTGTASKVAKRFQMSKKFDWKFWYQYARKGSLCTSMSIL